MRNPSVLIPYPGPSIEKNVHDILLYLRPETNRLIVESTILKVIHDSPYYHSQYNIVYLANIPGDFIKANRIIEEHDYLQIKFARKGPSLFTKNMIETFENYFSVSFSKSPVYGSFKAAELLKLEYEELFHLWVPEEDMLKINGQTVKKYKGIFIINYDIPAILNKYTTDTDIFVMILRSFLSYEELHKLFFKIGTRLTEKGIVTKHMPISYVFHYSKGPFEQILDGIGYIYTKELNHIELGSISFFHYLLEHSCIKEEIIDVLRNQIMNFRVGKTEKEFNILNYTLEDSYKKAYLKYLSRIKN